MVPLFARFLLEPYIGCVFFVYLLYYWMKQLVMK